MAWRSELPMKNIINMTQKNKNTTLKSLIEMSQMTLNDLILKNHQTPLNSFDSVYITRDFNEKKNHSESPHKQGLNQKDVLGAVNSMGNSKAHDIKRDMFFFPKLAKIRNKISRVTVLKDNCFFFEIKFLMLLIISCKIRHR